VKPDQLRQRNALVAQGEALLDRFPKRTGDAFVREMTAVANGLQAIAEAADRADRTGIDALERARTWRHLGNACYDLGTGRQREHLERASSAFARADALHANLNEPVEKLKVHYSWGRTLLLLCDGQDPQLAVQARDRFTTALALAPEHLPAAVPHLQTALTDATRVVDLLTTAQGLGGQIHRLEQDLAEHDPHEKTAHDDSPKPEQEEEDEPEPPEDEGRLGAADIQSLFGVLQREFEKDKPNLNPTRRAGLEDFMSRLGQLVSKETDGGNRSLADQLADRGTLGSMIRELQAQGKNPSLKGTRASAGSHSARLLAALQELKMFVFSAHTQSGTPLGLRQVALDLFPRIARLTTWIHQAGDDDQRVRELETDQARGLANEVRLFARRAHVMLARPVWSRFRDLVDANRLFFSGPTSMRPAIASAAASRGFDLDSPRRTGADVADQRWQDLRAASVAIFDLSDAEPQVYYELGIALAAGTQLLLLAREGTLIPFDVAQHVSTYAAGDDDLSAVLADEIDRAMYGLYVRGGGSSLAETLAHAERLAAEAGDPLLRVALHALRQASGDPVAFSDALTGLANHLGGADHEILYPRWPGAYPDPGRPRLFAVMPFRAEQARGYAAIAAAGRKAGVEVIRGDLAEGQQIIASIWEEICRATHVTVDLTGLNPNVCLELGIAQTLGRRTLIIGRDGTERALAGALPGAAKWRCHTYAPDAAPRREFQAAVSQFLATKASP